MGAPETESLPDLKVQSLILKADQDVSHGLVVRAMDIAKKGWVKKIVIGTQFEQKAKKETD